MQNDSYLRIRAFVRGQTDSRPFEEWVYSQEGLETDLGAELYLNVISNDYRDRSATLDLSRSLEAHLRARSTSGCDCEFLPDRHSAGMFEFTDILDGMQSVRKFGDSAWWLALYSCKKCEQRWVVATDSRVYDIVLFRRVKDGPEFVWPADLLTFSGLLLSARATGGSVRYADPESSLELYYSVLDLAEERPRISVTEIAEHLPIDVEMTRRLAIKVLEREKVEIAL